MSNTVADINKIKRAYIVKSNIFALIATISWVLYQISYPSGGYDLSLQLFAVIAFYPIINIGYLVFTTRKIALGIFFLTIYQTWNMFLSPYLGDEQVTAALRTVNTNYLYSMGFFSMLSVIALYIGFMWGFNKIRIKPFWEPSFLKAKSIRKGLIVSMLAGWILTGISSILGFVGLHISFISSISSMLPAVVGALLVIYCLRGGRNFIIILPSIIYLVINFIYSIGGTLFIYTIILLLGPVIAYITETNKIPYIAICASIILLMPVFINRHQYRNVGLYLTGTAKFELGYKILSENYSDFSFEKRNELTEESDKNKYVDNRFEGVTYLGQIVHCHEDLNYPLLLGKTFVWLPTMFLPRMFVPMRPGQNMGSEWAEYYGVKDPNWQCSINFPMLVEFYCNFGWFGMVILSLLNGLAIAWVMSLFCYGKGDVNLLILLFISLKIIVVEANVTLNYGLILQVLFICWLIKRLKR